jgi:hypothetical protein
VPNPGVVEVCQRLNELSIAFCIATTSGKPRVPISVKVSPVCADEGVVCEQP